MELSGLSVPSRPERRCRYLEQRLAVGGLCGRDCWPSHASPQGVGASAVLCSSSGTADIPG